MYAFAAALGRPPLGRAPYEQESLAPAAAPADPPAELATILPCTPQQPVRISGGCVLNKDGLLDLPILASSSLRRRNRGKNDNCSDCL